MIDYHDYRLRLNRCLDERRDPLEDQDIVAFLDAHPEHLQAFANECSDLRQVEALAATTAHPAAVGRRAPRHWLYAAAAVLLFGLGWFAATGFTATGFTATGFTATGQDSANGDAAKTLADARADARADTPSDTPNNQVAQQPSRILSATLQEVEPTLRPAAFYTVRDSLVNTDTITLEAYEQRSELR